MFTLFFLLPIALACLGMLALPFLVARTVTACEAPYEPGLGDAEDWRASLDVALGEAWFSPAEEAAPTPLPMPMARRVKVRPAIPVCMDLPMLTRGFAGVLQGIVRNDCIPQALDIQG